MKTTTTSIEQFESELLESLMNLHSDEMELCNTKPFTETEKLLLGIK